MMLTRLTLILLAIPLFLAVAYFIYEIGRADALAGIGSFFTSRAITWAFWSATAFAIIAVTVSCLLSSKGGRHLRAFADCIRTCRSAEEVCTQDFPELKPVVEALKERERRVAREAGRIDWIIKHIPGGLITIDDREIITMFNCPAFEPFGILAKDVEGKHLSEWHGKVNVQRTESPLLAALHHGKKQRMTLKIRDHYYDGINTPMIRDDGTIDGAVCLFVDATDRVKQEIELKRLDNLHMVGQIAASLGHEIRNPLTTIRGFLQMAERRKGQMQPSHFSMMIEEIDRINDILAEFLQLAKDRSVEKSPYALHTVIKQIMPLLESESSLAGIELRKELHPVPELLLNSGDIKQMILNLHRNAVDACDGQGTVTICTGLDAEHRPFLRVTDTGCGIATDLLSRVGTPFLSTKDNGTGLGLSVCYSIANAHKAKIEIESAVGRGTVVTVTFPSSHEHSN